MGNSNKKEKEPDSEEKQEETPEKEPQQAEKEEEWDYGQGFDNEIFEGTILSDGYSLEEVYETVDKSKTFAFCVFKETTEPFRHCGWYKVFLNDLGGHIKVTSSLLLQLCL